MWPRRQRHAWKVNSVRGESISHPFVRTVSDASVLPWGTHSSQMWTRYTKLHATIFSVFSALTGIHATSRKEMGYFHIPLQDRFNGPYFDRLYCSFINHITRPNNITLYNLLITYVLVILLFYYLLVSLNNKLILLYLLYIITFN